MTDTIANSVIGLAVDSTGVTSGTASATQAVKAYETAAVSAGNKAGAALTKGAKEGATAAGQMTREQERLIQTINNYSNTVGKSRGEILEYRAAQAGITTQVQAQIAAIKAQEAALKAGGAELNKYGISARQQAAALRGVPAQVTDIVTSLQGGQAPLTVLLQQGGQLKDMFGGVVPAAKALGGAVLGLVNPFTITAAAVAALTYAYVQGTSESENYNKALILTGNIAGITARQLDLMAQNIDAQVGTQYQAAEALAALAGTGQVAGQNLEKFGATAVRINRTVGTSVDDVAKQFAELGKDPVKASEKLNESMNYLTLAVYDQIKAAQENGREQEAASIAQNAYADAMDKRTAKLQENLGYIQRGWRAVVDAANEGWDAILGIGRPDGPGDKGIPFWLGTMGGIPGIAGQIGGGLRRATSGLLTSDADKEAAAESQRLANRAADAEAALQRENALNEKAKIAARKRTDDLAKSTRERADIRKDEIDQYKRDAALLKVSTEDQAKQIAKINEKYKDKKVAAPKAFQDDAGTKYLQQLRETEAALNAQLDQNEKLTASQKELAKFEQQIADIKEKRQLTADQKSLLVNQDAIRAQLEKNVAVENEVKAKEKAKKLAEQELAFSREMEGISRSIAAGQSSRNEQYERSLSAIGLGGRARQEIDAQRSIRREFDRYLRDATEKASKVDPRTGFTGLDSQVYRDQVVKIKSALDDALVAQQAYFDSLKEMEGDWRNGANEALANYLDDVDNAARRAHDLIATGLRGGGSSFADAIWDGNADSFKQLGDRIGKQILEGIFDQQIGKPIAQWLQGAVNDPDSMVGKLLGGLTGTKDTGENWLGFLGLGGGSGGVGQARGSSIANPLYVQSVNAIGIGGLGGGDSGDAIGGLIGRLGLSSANGSASAGGGWWDSVVSGAMSLFGRASGGNVLAGGMYEVAENAPELLTVGNRTMLMMGSQGGNVTPLRESRGGDTYVNNISVEGQIDRRTRQQIANDIGIQQRQGRRYA